MLDFDQMRKLSFDFPARSGSPSDRVQFGMESNGETFYYRRTGMDVMAYAVNKRGLDIEDLYDAVGAVCPAHRYEADQAYEKLEEASDGP